MQAITIVRLPLGPFQVNTYILICAQTRQSAVIDPADRPDTIVATLAQYDAAAVMILNTHGHPDHVLANAALKGRLGVPVWMHPADDGLYADSPEIDSLQRDTGLMVDTRADRHLAHGQRMHIGETTIRVIHTPGHTPGSCCFLADGHLFTGDTLFVSDAGRTDLKGGSIDALIHSIETRLLPLPDQTAIWPGHNYHLDPNSASDRRPPTTLGREKQENLYITDFILDP